MHSMEPSRSLRELVEEYTLLVALIVFSGHVYLTAYYSYYGMRLSDISPEFFHVVFRGITAFGTNIVPGVIIFVIFYLSLLETLSLEFGLDREKFRRSPCGSWRYWLASLQSFFFRHTAVTTMRSMIVILKPQAFVKFLQFTTQMGIRQFGLTGR